MPQGLGIIASRECTLSKIEDLLAGEWEVGHINRPSGNFDLHVQRDSESGLEYASIGSLDASDAASEYGENDELPPDLRAVLGQRNYFSITFNDLGLLKQFLNTLLQGFLGELDLFWIDDDYGRIIRGSAFLDKMQRDPDWDWRS